MTEDQIGKKRQEITDVMTSIGAGFFEPVPDGEPGQRRVRADKWPDPGFVDVGIRGDLRELEGSRYEEPTRSPASWPSGVSSTWSVDVMGRRMELDERIVVLGEDVDGLKGGTNGATKAALAKFPDRVLGTPISENAFAGMGGGMALDGRFRPVVEFMYADFMWVAADQIFNQIAKARHMFGGHGTVPLVLRSKLAAGTGYGSQHSMDPAGVLTTAAGLRVVAPSNPFDYVGLMNTALRAGRPGGGARTRRPLRRHRDRTRRRPGLPDPGRQGGVAQHR